MTGLAEYIARMKEDQKDIYFLGGETLKDIHKNPII
jgi:HSP90 family molecular chaperone